ncbi:putative solute carrier family 22 member 31 [Rhipicephalus sanguineus]|uniref:putative solute carrier family 22 member 31 n=1 Tax=Rhipicephalus sanguineus TaxID=34632 RepID=UPI0020C34E46|nr:putative solute carrier family 22 member 31 [Rhipicephalus sanguineus]
MLQPMHRLQVSLLTRRRPVLLTCAVITVVAAACTVFALTFLQLVLLRMLVAASLCGFSIVSIVLLFEVTYEANRTNYLCYVIVAHVICGWAPCLVSAAALVVDRRTLAFAFLVPVSLLLTSFQAVRESSRWLFVIDHASDFVERYYAAAGQKGQRSDADLDRTATRRLQVAATRAGALSPEGPRAAEASLQPGSGVSGMIVLPGVVARTASLSGLFFSLFVILNEASRCGEPEGSQACRGAQRFLTFWQTAVLVVPRVVSLLLAARLLQRCERKRALMLGLPLSCAAVALLAVVDPAHSSGGSMMFAVVVANELVMASVLVNLAFACVYCLELYMTVERAAGFGVVYSAGFVGGVAVSLLFDGQDASVRNMCGLALAVGALLLVDRLPETKDARLPEAATDAISELKRYSMSSTSKSFAEPRPSADYGYSPDAK